jgi:endonuclease YncB( thermonuclease family)
MKYFARIVSIIILSFFVFGCEKTNIVTVYQEINPLLDSTAIVTISRVVDGDTYNFGIGRDTISLRILDIDAFETRHGARLDSQAAKAHITTDSAFSLGQLGKKFADSLLDGQKVLLVRKYPDNFDSYNRLLRHVYYYQGNSTIDFGALMLQKGFALIDTL